MFTPISNWVLLFSNFSLVENANCTLAVIMIAGIAIQSYNGYYNFEIGHYLFELYAIKLALCDLGILALSFKRCLKITY
jgi:ABC-2 type transport system permease protein